MKFQDIYNNCKTQVRDTLRSWWITDSMNDRERRFIEEYIENYISKVNGDNVVIQSMYPWESTTGQEAVDAQNLVSPLWREDFTPFRHQYRAWSKLLTDNKSIVVTTGTGSGKTECFLVPVIKYLSQTARNRTAGLPHPVEALFLYPLNALMNDQKERIDKFLYNLADHGKEISFAVYNGNTPEDERDEEYQAACNVAKSTSENTAKEAMAWAGPHAPEILHERITRKDIRDNGSSILITNPSMLEYMLLRQKDDVIFQRSQGTLKWIVIDETHTFTGAAAAELAYLLRRVMHAFGVRPDEVRFVTSSATISGANGQADLKKFIADISGQTVADIEVIEGKRSLTRISNYSGISISQAEVRATEDRLYGTGSDNYMTINSLIASGSDLEAKLGILDSLTDETMTMKAKSHFFFPALDKGAQCRLADCAGVFPMYVCSECGHLVIASEVGDNGKLIPFETKSEVKDVFDVDEDGEETPNGGGEPVQKAEEISSERLISLLDRTAMPPLKAASVARISSGKLVEDENGDFLFSRGHFCPCCGKDNKKSNVKNYEDENSDETSREFLKLLTCPTAFIGRIIAPSLLEQMIENGDDKPHKGQQYISFVDSRQGCSKATLSQNVEVEREWVYSRILDALLKLDPSRLAEYNAEFQNLLSKASTTNGALAEAMKLQTLINKIQSGHDYLTWRDIADMLMSEHAVDFDLLYGIYDTSKQALPGDADIKRKFNHSVTVNDGKARRNAHSIMYYALSNRPKNANAPETLGLFRTYYPKLEGISVPAKFSSEITDAEWRDLLKVYLDFDVRNNGSFFIKIDDPNAREVDSFIDIFDLGRFKYSKEKRRPRTQPTKDHRIYKIVEKACPQLNPQEVIDEMWSALTTGNDPLLVYGGGRIEVDSARVGGYTNQRWVDFDAKGYYLNLYDIAFKLYDSAYVCPETRRPLDVCFKGLSPYYTKGVGYQDAGQKHPLPNLPLAVGKSYAAIQAWHAQHRAAIHHLWDRRLHKYYSLPMIFVQKEHTAQLDLQEARNYLMDFKKDHIINILACSTTMEMGVDVGSLELVVMNNVPPKAANYKQRAGRSGRMSQNRSASIALCGQDVHSRNVCEHPLTLINKAIGAPYVDFESKVILQRQINAYVFKSVFKHIALGETGTNLMDFFTDYKFAKENPIGGGSPKTRYDCVKDSNGNLICLASGSRVQYSAFTEFVQTLNDYLSAPQNVQSNIVNELNNISKVAGRALTPVEIRAYLLNTIEAAKLMQEEFQSIVDNLAQYFNDEAANAGISQQDLITTVDSFTFTWQQKSNRCFSKLLRGLHFKWTNLLKTNLLEFMSTHQFTPNANMPLDIIELIVSRQDAKSGYRKGKNKQPSADLVRALAQFAPGRVVTINNSVYRVGGVDWSKPFDYYKMEDGYLTISPLADGQVVIYPDAFRAEYGVSRDTSSNVFSQVSAQFLEMQDATVPFTPCVASHLGESPLKLRTSDSWDNTPYILYYNSGLGQGYSVCAKCGRAVVEEEGYKLGHSTLDPNGRTIWECAHKPLRRDPDNVTNDGKCDCMASDIKHGVIFAGKLQTNFSEIQLFKKEDIKIEDIDPRNVDDIKIVTTFAIVLCDIFADEVQRDRSEIDFFISKKGTLCVFDTAKGGAGISTQLNAAKIKKLIKQEIFNKMRTVTEPHQVLDRNTVRYYDQIDIELFKNWLEWAKELIEDEVPAHIQNAFPTVVKETRADMIHAIEADPSAILFFNSEVNQYDYYDKVAVYDAQGMHIISESGWITLGLKPDRRNEIHVVGQLPQLVTPAVMNMLKNLDGGIDRTYVNNFSQFGFCPIAYAGGRLYFSDNKKWNSMNSDWGYIVYSIEFDQNSLGSKTRLDIDNMTGGVEMIYLDAGLQISSDDLLDSLITEELRTHNSSMIQRFIDNSSDSVLTFTYTDEHLKSHLGILLFAKFIRAFIAKVNRPRNVFVKYVGERYVDRTPYCFNPKYDDWSFTQNFKYSNDRDMYLQGFFLNVGTVVDMDVRMRGSLPHWRSMEISNGTTTLVLYPDGGITNGWSSDNHPKDTDVSSHIDISLNQRIKYDVELR